jgi:hypothetical protein
MLALVLLHAVTSCVQLVTVLTAAMAVEVLVLLCTAIRIVLWSASPWVAAAPGVGNKVRKTKSSSRHGILTPVNLLN